MTLRRTNSWGYKQNNDTFDGMIGSMMRKEVDIAGSPMYFRTERHEGLEIIFHETLYFVINNYWFLFASSYQLHRKYLDRKTLFYLFTS